MPEYQASMSFVARVHLEQLAAMVWRQDPANAGKSWLENATPAERAAFRRQMRELCGLEGYGPDAE